MPAKISHISFFIVRSEKYYCQLAQNYKENDWKLDRSPHLQTTESAVGIRVVSIIAQVVIEMRAL